MSQSASRHFRRGIGISNAYRDRTKAERRAINSRRIGFKRVPTER